MVSCASAGCHARPNLVEKRRIEPGHGIPNPRGKVAHVDGDGIGPLVVMALIVVPLLGFAFVSLSGSARKHREALAGAPKKPAGLTWKDLTSTELGYLHGEKQRAVEVALMGLYLDGRMRSAGSKLTFVPGTDDRPRTRARGRPGPA